MNRFQARQPAARLVCPLDGTVVVASGFYPGYGYCAACDRHYLPEECAEVAA